MIALRTVPLRRFLVPRASVLLTNCIQESLNAAKLNLSAHLGFLAYQTGHTGALS